MNNNEKTGHNKHERKHCPLCNSKVTNKIWSIPFEKVSDPIKINKINLNLYPMLSSKNIYDFYLCNECESIYLNPVSSGGHKDDALHYIKKMKSKDNWKGYYNRYDHFSKFIPKNAKVFMDVACSVGQYAQIAKEKAEYPWKRIICLEYSASYVKYMKSINMEAYKVDLHSDNIEKVIGSNDVDFVVFSEAFEHMNDSLLVMKKLSKTLRPGGRIFFSAQALGGSLPIRPAETLYINEKGIKTLCKKTGTRLVSKTDRHDRFFVVLEKLKK
jgi:2-polyprenyl-3-methyl-5-hydroxy-6-metoxy-1,4-benzoquinol methylase